MKNFSKEKQFGILFSLLFVAIFSYYLFFLNVFSIYLLILSLIMLCLTFFATSSLVIPNRLWIKFGFLLGSITTPIILAFIFFFVIYPIGILKKIFNRNYLDLKIDRDLKSYWKNYREKPINFKKQF
jgi:hypothetical protein|tara:strand:+ start:194 stop:574 length:381 start_codon:yes stop_codon:yes gene_type:complete